MNKNEASAAQIAFQFPVITFGHNLANRRLRTRKSCFNAKSSCRVAHSSLLLA